MPDTQSKGEKVSRVQVRLPQALMRHVESRIGDHGLYADSSDYIRDLIRRDAMSEPSLEDRIEAVWHKLMPGATADESEFGAYSLNELWKDTGLDA